MAIFYYLIAGLLIIACVKKVIRLLEIKRLTRQYGCRPPVQVEQSERILGWGMYKTQMKAFKEHRVLQVGRERYLKYGNTWSLTIMGMKFINTIEEENIKTILATNFKDYGLGGRKRAFGDLLGDGIFTLDGPQWEHSRALIRPNFTKAQVADLNALEAHVQILLSRIPQDGSTIDIQALFFKFTMDYATEFLFGKSAQSLTSEEGSEAAQFGEAFDLAQSRLGQRSRLGKLVGLFPDKNFDDACKVVHRFADEILQDAMERSKPKDAEKSIESKEHPERYTFLDELLKSTQDAKQIRDELLNILLAGRDTTASLLGNTMHVLAQRPDVWKNLKAEVDLLDGQIPDYDTLRNMKYLKCLLNESLRLYPQVPTNARFAVRDTVLPRGGGPDGSSPIFIPKGGIVAYHTFNLHRLPSIYGPDATSFRPERWLPEHNLRPGWSYLPFNGGPRICVGQNFALTEAGYVLVRLVQEFERIESRESEEGKVWRENLTLTCCKMGGVKVGLIPR